MDRAFDLYRQQNNLPATVSFGTFYDIDNGAEPSMFMLQAVVEKLLAKCDLKTDDVNAGEDAIGELALLRHRSDEFCSIS